MRLSTYIFITFLFILLLFSITTYINFRLSDTVAENSRFFSKSTEVMRLSGRFQRNMLNLVSGLRGYLITGEQYFVASFDSSDHDNQLILSELSALIDDSVQIKLLSEIKSLNDTWVVEYADPLKKAKTMLMGNDSNLALYNQVYREKFLKGDEKRIQKELQEKFKEFTAYEYSLRDTRSNNLASSIRTTGRISLALTILSLIVGFVLVSYLVRLISRRISTLVKMADSIASGVYTIDMKKAGSDELSALVYSLDHMSHELSKNISELEMKNKELDQYAHIVSHDLKSPLRGIDNVISWIEEDHHTELTPKINEYLQTIKGRVKRAENLIQGVLSYARVDTEAISFEAVNVELLIDEIINDMMLGPNVVVTKSSMPVILSERIPLLQVFSNLISNAIKYNDKAECRIHISHKEYKNYYEFFVADNGPGIAQHYHKKIFVIFQTLVERDSFESTGVGLAIVKKILDARKQNIHVVSEPGHGTTFSFTWPKK